MRFNPDLWKARPRQQMLVLHIAFLGLLGGLFAATLLLSPEQLESGTGLAVLAPKCLFKKITGLPCLSCGMTRAFSSISRCEFRRATAYNPLSIPLYASGAVLWIFLFFSLIRGLARK